eukprot:CAMPEP_0117490148 /NCGR_PEP_ID=MMETSP0784-20121206/17401_1 /TAXON_ID=39447 /ORGANISM="" /LENGTH=566 /DNA_ID=CAMNT_0005284897 /DNA_START=284 /DNA_END=1984 /DNA_ORIENTATION=-
MQWTGISLAANNRVILEGVSGDVRPGEMACILGPSGAGKSTLLNILAGRMNTKAKGMNFSGEVSIGGTTVDPTETRSHIAYVMQEDALPGMSTPREILEMSAALRGSSRDEALAEQSGPLLSALRLEKCADTHVGTALVKGLSGGEKKRTAVAVELITKPRMIFLDEPLSGLDSYAAWTVVQVLKELASHGCAVLCTIHQPSSEIFATFDKTICLAEGKVCYCGEVNRLAQYMEVTGNPVPMSYNPADHILFQVQTMSRDDLNAFVRLWAVDERTSVLPRIESTRLAASDENAPHAVARHSFFLQLAFLFRRETREVYRNRIGLVMRFAVNGVMGLLFACIFQGIGGKDAQMGGLQGHFGAICNLMIGTMFGSAQPLLLQFPSERPVFLREYAANMYGVIPYFLSKTLVELPVTLLVAIESWLIGYWVMGLQGNFFLLVLTSWGLSLTAASTALFIGCSVTNAQSAQELAPLIFVPQIIFSGIFIPISLIPKALRWLQYLCALKYAINLGCIVEFQDDLAGKEWIKVVQGIDPDEVWLYLTILVAIFIGFRSVAMLALRKRARFVY